MTVHLKAADYLRRGRKPAVSEEERAQARELRSQGLTLDQIGERLGRVKSTIHHMLKRALP